MPQLKTSRSTVSGYPPAANEQYVTWARGVRDIGREHSFEPLEVEGQVPDDLNGVLYLNGPGLFSHFGSPYKYWPDGDGAITAIRLNAGKTWGACRVLESQGLVEERKNQQPLYGSVGTAPASWLDRLRRKYKNPANINVLHWAGRTFALYESGLPTEFDPLTLETIGETNFGGVVDSRFAAHPHHVPRRGTTYNFGIEYGRKTRLCVYEMRPNATIHRMVEIPLDWPPIMHDFIATDNHLIFFIPPLKVQTATLLMGVGSVMDNIKWKEQLGTVVIVVPIDDPKRVTRFRTDPIFQWQFANAYERQGEIVVDFVRYARFNMVGRINVKKSKWKGDNGSRGYFHRSVINLRNKTLTHEQRWDQKCELPVVFPHKEGQENDTVFLGGFSGERARKEGAVDQLVRLNIDRGVQDIVSLGVNTTFTEPHFVSRKGARSADEGYLLSLTYDSDRDRSSLVILDAEDLSAGPLARCWFDHHIPPVFHGQWIESVRPIK
ncbi:MAG: carotenoid oxygenase family protein [Salibacteraceae bacterium]